MYSNVLDQDSTECLSIFESKKKNLEYVENQFSLELEDEFESLDCVQELSALQSDVVSYIAGFVVRKTTVQISCDDCEMMLTSKSKDDAPLIDLKNRGGLIYPSKDTIRICNISERKIMEKKNDDHFFSKKNILQYLVTKILSCIITQFPFVFSGCMNEPNHKHEMIRKVATTYCVIRLKYLAKNKTNEMKGRKIRNKLSKLIHFKGQ